MDFGGFLLQLRIELDGIERAAGPLWALAVPLTTHEQLGGDEAAATADEEGR